MRGLGCLWHRSRLAALADDALDPDRAAGIARHITGCTPCRERVEALRALRAAVRKGAPQAIEPDWSGFWPALERRLRLEVGEPMREAWWRPYWKPIWGHPRAAMATAVVTVMLVTVPFWPGAEHDVPMASAGPVVVQDVATEDPDGSVMVYADGERGPEPGVTVIWVFASARQ